MKARSSAEQDRSCEPNQATASGHRSRGSDASMPKRPGCTSELCFGGGLWIGHTDLPFLPHARVALVIKATHPMDLELVQ